LSAPIAGSGSPSSIRSRHAFAADGTPNAIADIAVARCAKIHLSQPLPRRATIIDTATARPAKPAQRPSRSFRCPDVRPGQRVNDIPPLA
jgi:hypothetical protein